MGKLKVHELAKELGVQSKEIIAKANELGAKISSHLSSIDDDMANKIRKKYLNGIIYFLRRIFFFLQY